MKRPAFTLAGRSLPVLRCMRTHAEKHLDDAMTIGWPALIASWQRTVREIDAAIQRVRGRK